MSTYSKPLPVIESWNAAYWAASKRRQFVGQRCRTCGYLHLPPGPVCTNCLSPEQEWVPLSGKGTIYSYGIYYQLWHPGFTEDLPYNVALIQLAEGPQIISQVVGCKNEELDCGVAVEVVFEEVTPEITLPKFRLVTHREERP
jgi:uncharacterized OB-fold protein